MPDTQEVGSAVFVAHEDPAGHVVQTVAPARAYWPELHATGAAEFDAHALPAGHCVHVVTAPYL